MIGDGAKSRGEQQDNELDADESAVFPARIRHSTGASVQHRKTDKRKAQSEDVILEEEELEESPQRKAAAEERAQLRLERTDFLNEKAEEEYQRREKEHEMQQEEDRLKQTRKDLHEMHKANVRRQADLYR